LPGIAEMSSVVQDPLSGIRAVFIRGLYLSVFIRVHPWFVFIRVHPCSSVVRIYPCLSVVIRGLPLSVFIRVHPWFALYPCSSVFIRGSYLSVFVRSHPWFALIRVRPWSVFFRGGNRPEPNCGPGRLEERTLRVKGGTDANARAAGAG